MTHTDSIDTTNTAKTNTHNNQSKDTNTDELYSNFMNGMEYFSVVGFLLASLANYMIHEKRISD